MKKLLFTLYQKVVDWLWGTGLGRIMPVYWVYSLLFKMLRPSGGIMEVGGNKMYSRMKGLPCACERTFQAYIVRGGWEEETTRLFRERARKDDVIVDLGANIGYYTLLAAKVVGSGGKVYAFEPDPSNYKILTSNIRLNDFTNVITEEKAVSDKLGTLNLYLDRQDMGAHTIYKTDKYRKHVTVETITLDKYFEGRESPINIIKMDVEGAELVALRGMENIIKMNKDLKIFSEFHLPWIRRAGIEPEYFASLLIDYYKFTVTVIQDYTKHIKSDRIKSVKELMSICQDAGVVNLMLERE